MRLIHTALLAAGIGFGALCVNGCGSRTETAVPPVPADEHSGEHDHDHGDEHADHDHDALAGGGHDHGGWWCVEHGVPEEECALCDTSLVADFKAKDDWCDQHNRPQSQCFQCEPELFKKFAARYEAKFGEQPPEPTE